jgi:hypothetical protein
MISHADSVNRQTSSNAAMRQGKLLMFFSSRKNKKVHPTRDAPKNAIPHCCYTKRNKRGESSSSFIKRNWRFYQIHSDEWVYGQIPPP